MAWFNDERPATRYVGTVDKKGKEGHAWVPFEIPSEPILCFFCSKPVDWKQGVWWEGYSCASHTGDMKKLGHKLLEQRSYVFLHATCARNLSAHLAKDALLAEKKEYAYRGDPFHRVRKQTDIEAETKHEPHSN